VNLSIAGIEVACRIHNTRSDTYTRHYKGLPDEQDVFAVEAEMHFHVFIMNS
jgi:hypothetical protein